MGINQYRHQCRNYLHVVEFLVPMRRVSCLRISGGHKQKEKGKSRTSTTCPEVAKLPSIIQSLEKAMKTSAPVLRTKHFLTVL